MTKQKKSQILANTMYQPRQYIGRPLEKINSKYRPTYWSIIGKKYIFNQISLFLSKQFSTA